MLRLRYRKPKKSSGRFHVFPNLCILRFIYSMHMENTLSWEMLSMRHNIIEISGVTTLCRIRKHSWVIYSQPFSTTTPASKQHLFLGVSIGVQHFSLRWRVEPKYSSGSYLTARVQFTTRLLTTATARECEWDDNETSCWDGGHRNINISRETLSSTTFK